MKKEKLICIISVIAFVLLFTMYQLGIQFYFTNVRKDDVYANYGVYCVATKKENSTECEVLENINEQKYEKMVSSRYRPNQSLEIVLKDESKIVIEEYRDERNVWKNISLIEIDLISGKGLIYEINIEADKPKNSKPKNEKTIVEEFEFDPEVGPIHRFFEKDNTYCEIDYSTLQTECFNGNKR